MNELTIVIPSFNMQSGAIRAVESILQQNVEVDIIIVDDASYPALHLPKEISNLANVKILKHEKNSGAGAARNTGVAAAKTAWISFLDSDDVFLKDTLAERIRLAKEHEENNDGRPTIYGSGWIEPKDTNGKLLRRTPLGTSDDTDFASGCWYCPGSCIIGQRDVFLAHPFDERLSRLEDLDFGIRFGASRGRLIVFESAAAFIDRGKNARIDELISCSNIIRQEFEKREPNDMACAFRLFGSGNRFSAL
jgi:glycosyltransferase involved in cell wall biosynthesis